MLHVGTSGWNYDAWRGHFYPEKLSNAKMLQFYAQHFSTVEINYTFRRMPTEKALHTWASQTGEGFRFALKAPFWIVNYKKLALGLKSLKPFLQLTALLGEKRGPILFQMPPIARDEKRLTAFLKALPGDVMAAFEFRDASWFHDSVYDALAGAQAALCITDDEELQTPAKKTARWGYFRLRREDYDARAIKRWKKRIDELGFADAFVYFKHEDEARGPAFAKKLLTA
jgi:uncharacterized protein YecE (DUF72 family)